MRSHEEWHRKAAELLRCGHTVQRRADAASSEERKLLPRKDRELVRLQLHLRAPPLLVVYIVDL
jgi:hypothetical protein